MAGIFYLPGDRYDVKRKRREERPYRTVPKPGYSRQACWGRSGDPVPNTYDRKNCKGKIHNFRYGHSD